MTILLGKVEITSKKNGKTYTKFALFDEENCDAYIAFLEGSYDVPLGEVIPSFDRNGHLTKISWKGVK